MEVFPGISIDPDVRFGKPCLIGTRVDVATVLEALAADGSFEEVQDAFALPRDQIVAVLRYTAHIVAHVPPAKRPAD